MNAFFLLSLIASACALPQPIEQLPQGISKRAGGSLHKRFSNARFTWYPTDTGADACTGRNHGDNDWVVALNEAQFGSNGNGHCGKKIRISYGGKSAVATIVDMCPTCGYGDIDLTRGLYSFFKNDLGEFRGDWSFVGDGEGSSPPPPPPPKKPSPKPSPKPHKPSTTPSDSQDTTEDDDSEDDDSQSTPSATSSAVSSPTSSSPSTSSDTGVPANAGAPASSPTPDSDSGKVTPLAGGLGQNVGPSVGSANALSFNGILVTMCTALVLLASSI